MIRRSSRIRIAVIQGDINRSRRGKTLEPIPLERTSVTGLSHRDGAISMVRNSPDTAVASFFICVGDQQEMYERLSLKQGQHVDRCVPYVFRCAVYFAETPDPDPDLPKWWSWKE